jgi:hypothetical protein
MKKQCCHWHNSRLAWRAFAADDSLGTWKLNMDKSKFSPAAPVKSLSSVRDAVDSGLKVTTTGEQADGTAINASYTAKYDGNETPVTGAPYDTIFHQASQREHSHVHSKEKGRKIHSVTGRSVIREGETTVKAAGAPGGAATGSVQVTLPGGALLSNVVFRVRP